ncbi:hypothetical protein [Galbitalea soli]|uniref:Uncharacterized protein n=1 Tax=Galbitalea soli TaxID=1268042 RepID=A0A7C9TPZ6_9MICO|nr:hypothetical protein [Galbitalea soli]NEM90561.1 hypothetical protein [Galbitalea soli]NYJ31276.1 hypothetical protein [Galbitalea soli]
MTRSHLAPVSDEIAYRVPWHFAQAEAHYRLRNTGAETLSGVTFWLFGSGVMPASAPATLHPGDALHLHITGSDLARDTIGIVRWFRLDGTEYLWRVSF